MQDRLRELWALSATAVAAAQDVLDALDRLDDDSGGFEMRQLFTCMAAATDMREARWYLRRAMSELRSLI